MKFIEINNLIYECIINYFHNSMAYLYNYLYHKINSNKLYF